MQLPSFRYHPNPLSTGVLEPHDCACECCGFRRGVMYCGPVYSRHTLTGLLCPWCIADGQAATHFDATFSDAHPLARCGIAPSIIEEVTRRTPGYRSWQQDQWLVHCGDACEFHGDATMLDLSQASTSIIRGWCQRYNLAEDDWAHATDGYAPGGESAFYKFICRHCGDVQLGWDIT